MADTPGFTPAYAGNTADLALMSLLMRVHPRIRGEYAGSAGAKARDLGSPPHTRGIQVQAGGHEAVEGFTPAYAGNTGIAIVITCRNQVHPRIRGEYVPPRFTFMLKMGSPPYTRGIHRCDKQLHEVSRFTPAYAGNTRKGDRFTQVWRVHPRIRGEY